MKQRLRFLVVLLGVVAGMLLSALPARAASGDPAFDVDCDGFRGNGVIAAAGLHWKVRVARWADGNYAHPPSEEAWYEGYVAGGTAFNPSGTWASKGITIVPGTEATASYYWWEIWQGGQLIATGEDHFSCEPPPPPGGQGCTPGYWKQRHHFDSWVGYLPSTSFEAVVGRDVPGTPTMLDALNANGGGINALMRHTAAALLNSQSINYAYSTAQVISMFQAAFDSGNYEPTKDLFDTANNAGCPLN